MPDANAQLSKEQIYLENRVEDQRKWYSNKSGILKKRYRLLKILVILMGGSIPVLIGFADDWGEWCKTVAAVMGAAVAALEGISGVLKDKETFLSYRLSAEALEREKWFYQNGSGPYADAANAFQLFVQNCENIMANENNDWRNNFTQKAGEN